MIALVIWPCVCVFFVNRICLLLEWIKYFARIVLDKNRRTDVDRMVSSMFDIDKSMAAEDGLRRMQTTPVPSLLQSSALHQSPQSGPNAAQAVRLAAE